MNYDTSSRFDNKRFKEILKTYEDSIKSNSSVYLDADEFIDIADFYNEQDCMEAAEQVIDIAYKQHPNDTDILIFISRSYAMKGQIDKAYEYLNRIADQSDREVYFLRFDLFAYKKRWKEANEVANEIAEREEYAFETLIDLVDAYCDQNKKEYAKKWLNELKNRYGEVCREDDRMLETLSNYYYVFNEPEKSLAFFKKLIDKHPYSVDYWVSQAQCYAHLDMLPQAEESIDYALAINDENPIVLELKGGFRMEQGDLEAAYDYFKRFERYTANKVNAWNYLKHVSLQLDRFEETIAYSNLIIQSPNASKEFKAVAYSDMALALAYEEKADEGIEYASKAIKLRPLEPDFRAVRGFLYLKLNDKDKAEENFIRAENMVKINTDKELNCLMLIATYCFDAHDYSEAIHYFTKVQTKYGDQNPGCNLFLAYCWYQKKDIPRFLHYLAMIQKYSPDIYEQLGSGNKLMDDPVFNESIDIMKRDIANKKLNLSDYLTKY